MHLSGLNCPATASAFLTPKTARWRSPVCHGLDFNTGFPVRGLPGARASRYDEFLTWALHPTEPGGSTP